MRSRGSGVKVKSLALNNRGSPYSRTRESILRIHYWIRLICRVTRALGKALNVLCKGFTEYHPQYTSHCKKSDGKKLFAECFLWDTWQSLCRVLRGFTAKKRGTKNGQWMVTWLCRVPQRLALGKGPCFAECSSNWGHSAKAHVLPSVYFSPSVFVIALGK